MNEPDSPVPSTGGEGAAATAGAMLRAERERRGMHIAALAAAIKVPQRKLELLEADRYDELPDLTFTRALAQAVCRALKLDAQAVLDRLPQSGDTPKLARMGSGINAPFREPGAREEGFDWSWLGRPVVWGTLLVLAAAVGLAFAPESWRERLSLARARFAAPAAAPAASGVSVTELPTASVAAPASAASAAPAVMPPVDAASAPSEAASSAAPAAPVSTSGLLTLRANAQSWVEVQDARGQTLISRHLGAGESVGLDGALPLRVTVGNASSTLVTFRGQPVDLSANTVANVARIQLN